jgi:hypothetical protein
MYASLILWLCAGCAGAAELTAAAVLESLAVRMDRVRSYRAETKWTEITAAPT